jgi:hypothetical protein
LPLIPFSKYNENDEAKNDEIGEACSTNISYWWESQKERDQWQDQDVGGGWILER